MADAALALNVESSSVLQAANDLDRFSTAAERAGKAGKAVNLGNSGSIAKLVAEVQSANSKLAAIVGTLDKIASADRAAAAANDNLSRSYSVVDAHVVAYREHLEAIVTAQAAASAATAAADAHVVAYTQHLAGLARAQQDANAHVLAFRAQVAAIPQTQGDANAHVLAYRDSLNQAADGANKATTAIKFTAVEGLNASRQLADIGVTAASGMSPFLIALQQGPQLFDIIQQKAVMTGQSTGAVFKAAGAAIWAAMLPLLPIILPVIAAIGLLTAGVAALTAQANDDSGLKKYTTAMGYTKEEVKKLNAVTVTAGDTVKAVFQVAWRNAAEALGINTDWMSNKWAAFLDWLGKATRAVLAGVYSAIAGTVVTMKNLWKDGLSGGVSMDTFTRGYKAEYAKAQRFFDDVVKQSRANAVARQDQMAKAFYDKPAAGPKTPKSDAEKLADIVRDTEAQIKAEQARADAIGLSARAAAELEKRTDLLNQVTKAGIPITAGVRSEIDRLSKAYADAKIAADVKAAIEGVSDSLKKQRDAINDQLVYIGLYGDALTRARMEMEALAKARDALPKGETLTPEQVKIVTDQAGQVASDQINLDRVKRLEEISKSAKDAAYAMDLERGAIGLSGQALIAYNYAMDEKIKYQRAGIELSPEEVAAIDSAAAAYARQRDAIDRQKQALADAREVTKGFFSDWINGVRQGESIFKSFGDAVVNALNKIIDKLLDKTLEKLLDSMFSGGTGGFLGKLFGGGGGSSWYNPGGLADSGGVDLNKVGIPSRDIVFPNALGGVYGWQDPTRFAKGGAFTNTIVSTPTLFRFANGGKLGEMGEAGPEAIMPLKRGPNGALGVQMHGGGGAKVRMGDIHNTYQLSGALDQSAIMSMVRQGGEATYNQVKRDLESLLQQLNTDGAFAS